MRSYYYLVAQLPYLLYGQQPPMSSAEFKELASNWLSKNDMKVLEQVKLTPLPISQTEDDDETAKNDSFSYTEKAPPSGSQFIDKWREWERTLRLNIAKRRAVKLGRQDVITEPSALYEEIFITVQKLEAAESPLEAEMLVDKARWHFIDELQGMDHFSRNTVLAYLLKLLILERHASFQVETGFSEYKSIYASIMEKGTTLAGDIK